MTKTLKNRILLPSVPILLSPIVAPNLVVGARLAAENESQALDEKTGRMYELRLIALEKFATENGDDAVLFGENRRPLLAATVQMFMRECFVYLSFLRNVSFQSSMHFSNSIFECTHACVHSIFWMQVTDRSLGDRQRRWKALLRD